MIEYFKTDSRKLTYAEYWRITSSFRAFLVGAVAKLFRVPIFFGHGAPRIDNLILIDQEKVPASVNDKFEGALDECEVHKLHFEFFYTIPSLGKVKGMAAALLSEDGLSIGALTLVRGANQERSAFGIQSVLKDGRILSTTNRLKQMEYPPEYETERILDASVAKVNARHNERVAACKDMVVHFAKDKLEAQVVDFNNRFVDFQVQRGVFVPMTQEEIDRLGR